MSWIDKLVGRSPIGPMQEHMRAAVGCASQVIPLIDAMARGDDQAISVARTEIDRLEHAADELKHEIRSHMPRRLMLAMERRDMLDILDCQDSIADTAQDIAGMMVVRHMTLPEAMHQPLMDLTNRCVDACNHLGLIMEEMNELVGTGFRGAEADKVTYMIEGLNKIESETDVHAIRLMRLLFEHEDEIGPVLTMMWDRIIHWVGDLANFAERAGNRHRLLLAR